MSGLIDTHCHLTDLEPAEVVGVIERARACQVNRMICIGASKGTASVFRAIELAEAHPQIFASLGIHPHDAGSFSDLKEVEHLAANPRVVAIGETGLDFFRDWSPFDKQYELFNASLDLAAATKKPVVIHCRAAEDETIKILKNRATDNICGVFHCFSGNLDYARRILDLGFLISITGTITFKNARELRATVKELPLDRIMLETDAPYMAPEPFRGGKSEPMHVYQVALKIAELRGLSLEEVATQTTTNAEKLFGLA